jgi:hypothetical protein
LGKLGILIRYAVENEKMKGKIYDVRRQVLLQDMRYASQASQQEFTTYLKQNFKAGVENKPPDSAAAARELISRGVAHGRKRK